MNRTKGVCLASMASTLSAVLLMVPCCLASGDKAVKGPRPTTETSQRSKAIWSGLLQRNAFPYLVPIPPETSTVLDGTYTKVVVKEGDPVHCRR